MAGDPYDDPRITAIGLLVGATNAVAHKCGAVFREHGISGSDFDVLIRLARSPYQSLRLTDLAAQTWMSTSGITRVIDRLEKAGLARRAACATDRRSFLVGLTDEGNRRLAKLVPELTDAIDHSFTGVLPADELDAFLATLQKIRGGVQLDATTGADACTSEDCMPPEPLQHP